MTDRIVINTGPIIALARGGALELLGALPLRFVCPPQVEDEVRAGSASGHPVTWPRGVQVLELRGRVDSLASVALDVGEAAVIQLAREQGIDWVCIDERKGRRAALAIGLQVVGSLGLLGRAKSASLMPGVRPITDRLMS